MPNSFADSDDFNTVPDEVEAALLRQDEAMALLERLRAEEPVLPPKSVAGGGRRDFKRWPTPPTVTAQWHDGLKYRPLECVDVAVGGSCASNIPAKTEGPFPVRLNAPGTHAVLVLADIMWRSRDGKVGLRFEFADSDERDRWAGALIDALLAHHALN